MTDQNATSRPVTETENVVSFLENDGTSSRLASRERMQSMPDGMPYKQMTCSFPRHPHTGRRYREDMQQMLRHI